MIPRSDFLLRSEFMEFTSKLTENIKAKMEEVDQNLEELEKFQEQLLQSFEDLSKGMTPGDVTEPESLPEPININAPIETEPLDPSDTVIEGGELVETGDSEEEVG